MILKSVTVRSFKCINDSGSVRIEPGVTCLVGKNESGKTAFLEPLYRLNPLSSGHRDSFEELYDYPRRRRAGDRKKIPGTAPIEAEFELEGADLEAAEDQFGPRVLTSTSIKVSKNYQNTRLWNLEVNEKAFVKHLVASKSLAKELAKGTSSTAELIEQIQALEEPHELAKSLIKKFKDFDLEKEVREFVASRLPKFLYFDEYSTLPGRFSIPYLQETKENELDSGERTALALLRLAGVDSDEFLETEYEARKAALEAAAVQITDEVFEFWSQNRDLRVDFDVDFKATTKNGREPPFLEVRIWNDRHRVSLNFGERSTGFVWFFSFLAYFSEFRNTKERLILLLDEPGLGLHASAQEDLLRFIDERLAPNQQVIYTTHSPFMIKARELERTRTVEDINGIGTKISEDVFSVTPETIFPLQAALGYQLSQTLFVGPDNLIVEGPSDILYLQIVSQYLDANSRTGLDQRWVIVPAGGIDKIPTFIALLGTQLNIAVVLDVTASGNQRIESMVKRGLLQPRNLFPLTDITGGHEADIEDLFEVDFYLELLDGAGIAKLDGKSLPKGRRILKRIEKALRNTFNHYNPAVFFLREQDKLLPKLTKESLDRFEELFKRVNSVL
ncbi:MAG: AAA family ATPase [Desulfobacterales bacterium]|nr:AAA family ATPase [Desulfobacterales bacterium]